MAEDRVPLTIETRTTADTAGLDQAGKALDNVAAKGDAAGKGSLNAAKGLGIVGQAAGAASGSVGAISSLLAGLSQKIPALAGPITVATAAFATWAKAISAARQALRENAEEMRASEAADTAARISKIAEAYDRMKSALDAVNSALDRQRTIEEDLLKMARAREDAQIDLEEQQALAGIAPGDDIGRRRVEARFAARRGAVGASRQGEDASRASQAFEDQAGKREMEAILAEEKAQRQIVERRALVQQASAIGAERQEGTSQWWRSKSSKLAIENELNPKQQAALDKIDAVDKDREAALAAAREARADSEALRRRAEIAGQGVGTAAVRGSVAAVSSLRASAEIDRAEAERAAEARRQDAARAEAERIRSEIERNEAAAAEARRRAAFENADASRAGSALDAAESTPGKSGPVARGRELADLRAALEREQAEARAANAEAVRIIQESTAANRDLAARLRQVESRIKSASADLGESD